MRFAVAETFKSHHLLALSVALVVAGIGIWLAVDLVSGHGTCSIHHMYRVYDGTHDGDGDGVGCETLPEPPGGPPESTSSSSSGSSAGTGYDRDNWSFNSSSARAELMCDSTEHVDHVVALKEAYDSGAANWTNARKRQFANDRANLWCLEAGVNISKSDHDLAEWSGGSCEQRQYIASVTIAVKNTYGLSIDPAERVANEIALAAQCSESSSDDPASGSNTATVVDDSAPDFPAGRIVARRLDDGRIEFAYRPEGGEVIAPTRRLFPTSARVGRWLNSSPLQYEGQRFGRISARSLANGRIEFSFVLTTGERILPRQRLFPASSSGKWLQSTLIDAER
jgi:hypothetical protein